MAILRTKNWNEFQHYKDRPPVWIKLHKKLLDDRVFLRLPDASRALAPLLWLLASESPDGIIVDYLEEIPFRLRMTEKKVEEALNPLIQAGYFFVEEAASNALAEPEREASLEKRREEEKEKRAFEQFSLAAEKHHWPQPSKLTDDRRRKLRARLAEHGEDGWAKMLEKAAASDFLRDEFKLKFDWAIEPRNFQKIIEGNYDKRSTGPPVKFN